MKPEIINEIAEENSKDIHEFFLASKLEIEKGKRRKKQFTISLVVLCSFLLIGFVFVFLLWQNSRSLQKQIENTSKANAIATNANTLLELDPTLAFRLAEESYKIAPTPLNKRVLMAAYAKGPFYRKLVGHTGGVTLAKFSRDEKYILSSGFDKTIRLWETQTGKEILNIDKNNKLTAHPNFPEAINISPDCKFIIGCGEDSLVKIWDIKGNELHALKHNSAVSSAIFSPQKNLNGKWEIISASNEQKVRIWDTKGKLIRQFIHDIKIDKALFSVDGNKIITAGHEKIFVWDINGKCIFKKEIEGKNLQDLSLSSTGNKIAYSTSKGDIYIMDLKGTALGYFKAETFYNCLSFSNSDSLLASSDNSGNIYLFNINNGNLIRKPKHEAGTWHLEFSADDKRIVSANEDGLVKVFDLHLNEILVMKGHSSLVYNSRFSKNGSIVLTCSKDNSVRIWNLFPSENTVFAGHGAFVSDIEQNSNGQLFTVGWDYTARKWDKNGKEIGKAIHAFYQVSTLLNLGENKWVTNNRRLGEILIFDQGLNLIRVLKSKKILAKSGHYSFDNNKKIFALYENAIAIVWDTAGKEMQELMNIGSSVFIEKDNFLISEKDGWLESWNYVEFRDLPFISNGRLKISDIGICMMEKSPKENFIAIAGNDSTISIYETKNFLNTIEKAKPMFISNLKSTSALMRFSPNNNYLLLALNNNKIILLNLKGEIISSFNGHSDIIQDINFSSDGKRIVSCSADKSIRLWDLLGNEIMYYGMHKALVNKCKFSEDGKYILTASNDKTACMMPTSIEMVLDKVNKEKVRGDVYKLSEQELIIYGIK